MPSLGMHKPEAIAEALSPHIFAGAKALANRTLRDEVERILEDANVCVMNSRSPLELMLQITSLIIREWGNPTTIADTLVPSSLPLQHLITVLKAHGGWSEPSFKEEVVRNVLKVGAQLESLFTDKRNLTGGPRNT